MKKLIPIAAALALAGCQSSSELQTAVANANPTPASINISDLLAVIAIIVSVGALALEVRRWVETGPSLVLNLMEDAIEIPAGDNKPKLALFVTNRGSVPTTITNMVLYEYPSAWARYRKRSTMQAVVNCQTVPAEVGINRQWMGKMLYDDQTMKARQEGRLYVGVIASHSQKKYLVKVPPRVAEPLQT
ncbi:hypothetical protein [Mesorhizobium sp. A556]